MARFLLALLAATVVAVQAGGQLGDAGPAAAEVFWRAVLPHSPLPDAILRLIQPAADTSFLSKARVKPPFHYQEYIRSSSDDESSERTAGARELEYDDYSGADKRHDATFDPFNYIYKAPSKTQPGPFSDHNYKAPSKSQGPACLTRKAGRKPPLFFARASSSPHSVSLQYGHNLVTVYPIGERYDRWERERRRRARRTATPMPAGELHHWKGEYRGGAGGCIGGAGGGRCVRYYYSQRYIAW